MFASSDSSPQPLGAVPADAPADALAEAQGEVQCGGPTGGLGGGPTSGPARATVAEVSVTLPADLHARPAGRLARSAAVFESSVILKFGDREINPTGILSVMSLGATAGSVVSIRADGPDAERAVRALAEVLEESD